MNYLKENNIQAVGFDAFGTLIESNNKISKLFYKLIKKYGGNASKIRSLTTQYSQNPELFFEKTFRAAGIEFEQVTNKDKDELLMTFNNSFENYKLLDCTEKLISKVKQEVNYTFLISNLSSLYIPVIEKLGLKNYFNFILYSCELGIKKTPNNNKIFNKAFSLLANENNTIKPQQIIFTGDNLTDDIKAAKKSGFQAIEINSFKNIILNI